MVKKTPDEHFGVYTPNNAVKHRILTNYLAAYLGALSRVADAVHYIDGFAGRGTYADDVMGSPLRALNLLAESPLPFAMSLVEASLPDCEQLRACLSGASEPTNQIDRPIIENGDFSEHLIRILARNIFKSYAKVSTFAFIDPCGVSGVRMVDIGRILDMPHGECLLFWNFDGFNRLLGGAAKGTHRTTIVSDLLGDESATEDAMILAKSTSDVETKGREMLNLFVHQLKGVAGAKYVIPFRFFAPNADRTSHYLIHCCGHSLGFKIMKDVMGKVGPSSEAGTFEFIESVDARKQIDWLSPSSDDDAMAEIINHLRKGACRTKVFTQSWVLRPTDFLRETDYRRLLLLLEDRGVTEVLEKEGKQVVPAARRRRGPRTTIGPELFVRLRNNADV